MKIYVKKLCENNSTAIAKVLFYIFGETLISHLNDFWTKPIWRKINCHAIKVNIAVKETKMHRLFEFIIYSGWLYINCCLGLNPYFIVHIFTHFSVNIVIFRVILRDIINNSSIYRVKGFAGTCSKYINNNPRTGHKITTMSSD